MLTDSTPEEPAAADRLERQLIEHERRLLDQEHKLLEQEHRLWPAIRNFLAFRDLRSESEEAKARYQAARSALIRRLVFRPGALSIAVGGAGLAGILVAAWTALLFQQQNLLFEEQNAHFREQTAELRAQNEQQLADTLIVRRAQLLNTIYDCKVVEGTPRGQGEPICKPIANARAREEAVLAFLAIERGRQTRPNLTRVDLSALGLDGANLTRANFTFADFRRAYLRGADLHGTFLLGANLRGARLARADLSGAILFSADLRQTFLSDADLSGANLRGARFARADLSGADLSGADLHGADLHGTFKLTQQQIDSASGDVFTELPPGLTRPSHWKDAEGDQPAPPDAGNLPSP